MKPSVPDKSILHRIGYHSNQEGIALRYIREVETWNTHLSNTKRFIINAVRKIKPPVVTVLGSGWLLDVPVQELLMHTTRVRLVDIVHPPDILRNYSENRSVEIVIDDVTGGLPDLVWRMTENKNKPDYHEILRSIESLDYKPEDEQGMVISVNLLSQLCSLPFEYLLKKKLVTEDFYPAFAAKVQEKHLAFLKKNSAVLITDYEELHTDRNGMVSKDLPVHCKLPSGQKREEWVWQFDTNGSYKQGNNTSMRVVAIHI